MLHEATLLGHIGKKDIRTLKDGSEMATLYLATNRSWTDKNGVKQEQTMWHNVNFFNKLTDIVKRYAHVGNMVYIKGDINHKQIINKQGEKQWVYSVTAEKIRLLSSPKKKESTNDDKKEDSFEGFDDEIPF